MIPQQHNEKPVQPIVFWSIWYAIFSGLLIIQFFAAGGIPSGADQGEPPIIFQLITWALASASIIIRFWVIPKLIELQKKFTAMIIGLSFSEAIGIMGAFIVPPPFAATKLFMLGTSIVCIVMFAPIYAKQSSNDHPFQH